MSTLDTPELSRFLVWKERLTTQDERIQRAERWLFTHASVVLLAQKAGELLNLDLAELQLNAQQAEDLIARRCSEWELEMRTLLRSHSSLKLVVYRPDRVDHQLASVPPCILHGVLGYPAGIDASSFLQLVAERWNNDGAIPHEIGFALGYNVDDVLGYMGIAPLECKGFCGWQVFSDLKEAQRLRCEYQNARSIAFQFVAA